MFFFVIREVRKRQRDKDIEIARQHSMHEANLRYDRERMNIQSSAENLIWMLKRGKFDPHGALHKDN